jgi:cyclophilin family peptidyl-prolyl cis-trans isomerase
MTTPINDTIAPITPSLNTSLSFKVQNDAQVTFETNLGSVVFELNASKAPITVSNMLHYVNDGFYNGTLFHRVIPGFMVQGGGLVAGLVAKTPTYAPIQLESNNGLLNLRGTLAMARTAAPDTATSQFFVNLVDNSFLDYAAATTTTATKPGYAVFGQVITGMTVIDTIAAVETATYGSYENVPTNYVTIVKASQTQFEKDISKTGVVAVGGLETGASWQYSFNGGETWLKGKGSQFTLPEGTYDAHMLEVRQKDAAGNLSAGVDFSDNILVVDKTAPKVTTFSPTNGDVKAAVADNIVLTFDEDILLAAGDITLKTAAGEIVQTFTITASTKTTGNQLTINPTLDLHYGTKYTLEIASSAITDVAGNAYTSTKPYQFTTTDTVTTAAPSYTLTTEANKLKSSGTSPFVGIGNDAANVIAGGIGNDTLNGKLGNDKLIGGAGVDAFVFDTALSKDNIDTITGFTERSDQLQLDSLIFKSLAIGSVDADSFVNGTKAKDANDYLLFDSKTGALYYDADGNGTGASVKFAILTGVHDLSAADFFVFGTAV